MMNVLFGFLLVGILIAVMVGLSSIGDSIKDNSEGLKRDSLLPSKQNLSFIEKSTWEEIYNYKSLMSLKEYNEYVSIKNYLSESPTTNICNTEEENKNIVLQHLQKVENNKIKTYTFSITDFSPSYNQEEQILTYIPNIRHKYNIFNNKLDSGGKTVSSCYGQSYIPNNSTLNIDLIFNHLNYNQNLLLPIPKDLCKRLLDQNKLYVSIIFKINDVYHRHDDNSSWANANAMIELREKDNFNIMSSILGFYIFDGINNKILKYYKIE